MSYLSDYKTTGSAYHAGMINPVLAQLYHQHGINGDRLLSLNNFERAGLCDEIIELMDKSFRPSDFEMATDILLSLLRHAEHNLKEALSERLSVMDNAPLRLILQFINEDIEISKPILMHSKALNDLDLIYIIQSKDSSFWKAIAQREDLGENVVETLVDTKDIGIASILVENRTAQFSDYSLEKITELANNDNALTDILIKRLHQSEGEFARKIYAYAGEALKQALSNSATEVPVEITDLLNEVIGEFADETQNNFVPNLSVLKAADLFLEQGKLNITLMMNTLRRGQMSSFMAQFSRFSGMPIAVVVAMLQQRNGQGLSIAAKANGISRQDFMMMYNFTRKILGENYVSSNDLTTALAYYDRVTPDVAKRLMKKL